MQQGRGFRAAIPRSNLYDCTYNGRLPMRWNIEGSLIVSTIVTWPIAQPAHLQYDGYFPLSLAWRHSADVTAGGHTIHARTEFMEGYPDGAHQFFLEFNDGAGSSIKFIWKLTWPTFPVNYFFGWPVNPPTSLVIVGAQWINAVIILRPVRYANEP
jgi:hypothetical protein